MSDTNLYSKTIMNWNILMVWSVFKMKEHETKFHHASHMVTINNVSDICVCICIFILDH